MRKSLVSLVLSAALGLAACGGGEGPGEPLVAGSLAGEYKGQAFVPAFGFATIYKGANLIGLGDGPLNCGSPDRPDPPSGTNGLFSLPTLEAKTYSSVVVQLLRNNGNFEGVGSNSGTITLTAVSDTSVAGTVSYSYTDDARQTYGLTGTFEVARCPM
jgi:hypothetical protein